MSIIYVQLDMTIYNTQPTFLQSSSKYKSVDFIRRSSRNINLNTYPTSSIYFDISRIYFVRRCYSSNFACAQFRPHAVNFNCSQISPDFKERRVAVRSSFKIYQTVRSWKMSWNLNKWYRHLVLIYYFRLMYLSTHKCWQFSKLFECSDFTFVR